MNSNNKNKFRRNNWIQFSIWIITIILLVVFIVIPKNERMLQILFLPFMILLVVVPIFLIIMNLNLHFKKKPKFNSFFVYFPMIALCVYQVLPFYYFFESINETGQAWMYGVSIPVMVYFVTTTIILKYKRMYSFKLHSVLSLVAMGLFIASFLINVYLSYYFSVNW